MFDDSRKKLIIWDIEIQKYYNYQNFRKKTEIEEERVMNAEMNEKSYLGQLSQKSLRMSFETLNLQVYNHKHPNQFRGYDK